MLDQQPSEKEKAQCLMVGAENLHRLVARDNTRKPACKEPAMTIDILPTIAHLVGAKLPKHIVDGKIFGPFCS